MIFHVRVKGRLIRITSGNGVIDCRDVRTGEDSQAIAGDGMRVDDAQSILADSQIRDAIRSAYYNATCRESGKYPLGGDSLPDAFEITLA